MLQRAAAVAWIALLAGVGSAGAQPPTDETTEVPTLQVRGSAEVRADPDEATVRLGVLAQQPTAREAQSRANEIAAAVLAGLRELDIPESDIQTSELRLNPVYAPSPQPRPVRSDEPQEPKIVAYQATNVVSVRLTDLSKVGPAIDAGLEVGANRVEGVTFGLQNDLPVRQQALRRAVREARSKAKVIADALEVELGKVLEVTEGAVSVRMPRFPGGVSMMRSEVAAAAPTPVAGGQITVSADVSIRYRIE
jgi:uncharacterized protein YggE